MPPVDTNFLYAFLAREPDGSEGIVAECIHGRWMPFITGTESGRKALEEHVRELKLPRTVRLVKFERKEVLATFAGEGA